MIERTTFQKWVIDLQVLWISLAAILISLWTLFFK